MEGLNDALSVNASAVTLTVINMVLKNLSSQSRNKSYKQGWW